LAKGTNLMELVPFLRVSRKQRNLPALGAAGEALLQQRILPTQWYPHDAFIELIQYAFDHILNRSEQAAYDMGATGGRAQLTGAHKALLQQGDPRGSVLAMRHAWRMNFNFGQLTAESDASSVLFTLSGYEDVSPAHGLMIAGWGIGAARMAGASHARAEVLKRPWSGASQLVYRVDLSVPTQVAKRV
jgi:hypothetical protein